MLKFLFGLPHVMRGPLIEAARSLDAPVLISANALSVWKKDASDIPAGMASKLRTCIISTV